jgi:hypothetical protein
MDLGATGATHDPSANDPVRARPFTAKTWPLGLATGSVP